MLLLDEGYYCGVDIGEAAVVGVKGGEEGGGGGGVGERGWVVGKAQTRKPIQGEVRG